MTFAARAYGQNVRDVLDFVEDFSELGDYLDMPFGTYSSGHEREARLWPVDGLSV